MLDFELRGAVALVQLNRPEKKNALSRVMLEELETVFERIEREPSVRAVVLKGTDDGTFSAGTDIFELSVLDQAEARRASELGQRACERLERSGVPVIAALDGIAAGGGLELALCCHIRIASTRAALSLPEIKLGLIPAYGGTQRLARLVGEGRALEMLLTGRRVSAAEALALGLLNRIVEPEHLLAEALSLAREISSLAPLAIRACLEAVTRGRELPLEEGLALEAELFSSLFETEDMREGTRAFLEKRAPVFQGK